MPRLRSPFVEKPIACPACKTETNQRFFRQHLFIPTEKESDEHITNYKWMVDDVRPVNPAYHVLFYCPRCYYTDTTEDYTNPTGTLSIAQMQAAFKKAGAKSILIPLLGQHIHYEDIDFETALNLHLLAIHLYQLPQEEERDAYKLARLYLRVAWLYRERNGGAAEYEEAKEEPEVQNEKTPANGEAQSSAPEVLAVVEDLEKVLGTFADSFQQLQPLLRRRALEIARASHMDGVNPYPSLHASLEGSLRSLQELVDGLKGYALRDITGVLLREKPEANQTNTVSKRKSSSIFGSHDAFLQKVQKLWPDVPLNEDDALKTAADYFQKAMNLDARLSGFTNYVRIASLVTDLMLRRNNLDGAFDMVRSLYRCAIDTRVETQAKMREPGVTEESKRRMEGILKRASTALDSASDMRRDLLEKLLQRDLPRIKELLRQPDAGTDMDKILIANGIQPDVIQLFRQSQSPQSVK